MNTLRQEEIHHAWRCYLYSLDVSENDFKKEVEEMSKQFKRDVSVNDAVCSMLRKVMASIFEKEPNLLPLDWRHLKMAYYSFGRILHGGGKDGFQMFFESKRMHLEELKADGRAKVKILSTKGCENCAKYGGKAYSISEAMKKMLIPVKDCNSRYGYCRCVYLPFNH